jgi:hypothetical protein
MQALDKTRAPGRKNAALSAALLAKAKALPTSQVMVYVDKVTFFKSYSV